MDLRPQVRSRAREEDVDLGGVMKVAGILAKRRQEAKKLDTPARGGALWAMDAIIDDLTRQYAMQVKGFNARHFRKTCGQEHVL